MTRSISAGSICRKAARVAEVECGSVGVAERRLTTQQTGCFVGAIAQSALEWCILRLQGNDHRFCVRLCPTVVSPTYRPLTRGKGLDCRRQTRAAERLSVNGDGAMGRCAASHPPMATAQSRCSPTGHLSPVMPYTPPTRSIASFVVHRQIGLARFLSFFRWLHETNHEHRNSAFCR